MATDIRLLIRDYLAAGARVMAELREAFPALINVLDRRSLGIPQGGVLPSGRKFFFHGIGCRFELDGNVFDMDFGPNGETDGFDAWRIVGCQEERVAEAGLTLAKVEQSLLEMHENGELVRQPNWPLYFLKT